MLELLLVVACLVCLLQSIDMYSPANLTQWRRSVQFDTEIWNSLVRCLGFWLKCTNLWLRHPNHLQLFCYDGCRSDWTIVEDVPCCTLPIPTERVLWSFPKIWASPQNRKKNPVHTTRGGTNIQTARVGATKNVWSDARSRVCQPRLPGLEGSSKILYLTRSTKSRNGRSLERNSNPNQHLIILFQQISNRWSRDSLKNSPMA